MDPLIGQTIDGRFEVRARLGQGGMGTVYLAYQRSVDREVAIKLMDPAFSRDPIAVRRFEREAQLASRLSQPNTVSVFDFGTAADGRLFIAMELIRGRTLHAILSAERTFSIERAARIGIQICDALEAAHRLGIVHRDLKLDNVMVLDDPPGRDLVKVLDFGLAKKVGELDPRATGMGIVVGTPRYIAPEVAIGGDMSPAADVYALGVILAELVLGRPLWEGDDLSKLLVHKLAPRAAVVNVPGALHALVNDLIAAEPQSRPSAAAVREQLARIQTMPSQPRVVAQMPLESGTAATVAQSPRGRRTQRWGPVGFALLAIVLAGLIVVGFVMPSGTSMAVPPKPDASVVAADPWAARDAGPAHNNAQVVITIDTDPPGGMITIPGEIAKPAPLTAHVGTSVRAFPVVVQWIGHRKHTESIAFLRLVSADRSVVIHAPTHGNHVVRHEAHCTLCAPPDLAAPAIIHITSNPDHVAVTLDDQPLGTTPFDLDVDLDAPKFVLVAGTVRAVVTPDRDQTVELSVERNR